MQIYTYNSTIYAHAAQTLGIYMYKICNKCSIRKSQDDFYKLRRICKECWNLIRRSKYKPSICSHCKTEFRPGVEGRYKFCSEMCRFMAKVDKSKTGCWLWTAGKDNLGYGKFVPIGKRNGLAHRTSYRLFKGPISDGLLILHSCHNPSCVNPDHLRQGTDADNASDKSKAKRGNQPFGKEHHNSKLTETQVLEIRDIGARGNLSYTKIALLYGVNAETISNIVRRKTWKCV